MSYHIRTDDLGHETQFILCTDLVPYYRELQFRTLLNDMALGYTMIYGEGGWRGKIESICIYKVASLDEYQRNTLIHFLLTNTSMQDLYVVLPGGMACGYSLEADTHTELTRPLTQSELWNTSRGTPYKPGCILDTLHGTRRTGWAE